MIKLFHTTSQHCSRVVTENYSTSFSSAIRLLHKDLRTPIFNIYGFVRFADEIVDTFHEYDKVLLLDHNIVGNPNLKAENSNSFNGSLNWTAIPKNKMTYSVSLGTFYNEFNNQIDFALASATSNQYTYFNVNKAKTTGVTFENKFTLKNLEASLGFSYIGFYRKLYDDKDYIKEDTKEFLWSPELSTSVSYTVSKLKTKLNLFYKYTGERPQYVTGKNTANQPVLLISKTGAYHLADFISNTQINKYIGFTAGVKNIFDVTNINNSVASTGSIHNAGNAVSVGYGRSYFIGLNFQWNKK